MLSPAKTEPITDVSPAKTESITDYITAHIKPRFFDPARMVLLMTSLTSGIAHATATMCVCDVTWWLRHVSKRTLMKPAPSQRVSSKRGL